MKCITENCEETISPLSKLERCPNCRASIGAWQRRDPDDVLQRRKNLAKYQDRMSILGVSKNVVIMRRGARR